MSSEKSTFEQSLESLAPEHFAKVAETVEAERLKRDRGASEAEFRRKVSTMNDHERREFVSSNFGYSPKA